MDATDGTAHASAAPQDVVAPLPSSHSVLSASTPPAAQPLRETSGSDAEGDRPSPSSEDKTDRSTKTKKTGKSFLESPPPRIPQEHPSESRRREDDMLEPSMSMPEDEKVKRRLSLPTLHFPVKTNEQEEAEALLGDTSLSPPLPSHAAAAPSSSGGGIAANAQAATRRSSWSNSVRQRLFDRVFTPRGSPWMSFTSALGLEGGGWWNNSSDDDEEDGDEESGAVERGADTEESVVRSSTNDSPAAAGTAIGDEERISLLPSHTHRTLSFPGSGGSAAATSGGVSHSTHPRSQQRTAARRSWYRRLRRYTRRHAGWCVLMAVFLSIQLIGVLVMAGGIVALRSSYPDVLLHLSPWGVTSCVCGAGISLLSFVLVLCLRRRAVLGAVGALLLLSALTFLLVGLTVGSLWLLWMVWYDDSAQSLVHVEAVWQTAVNATAKNAREDRATANSPICLFQARHQCSGFRYGCCNPDACFGGAAASSSLSSSSSWLSAEASAEMPRGRGVPEWAAWVCPVCWDGCRTSEKTGWANTSAPEVCAMSLLPSMWHAVLPYACLNVTALVLVVAVVACTRLLHRMVRTRSSNPPSGSSSSAARRNLQEYQN